jgi:hypothetical protein
MFFYLVKGQRLAAGFHPAQALRALDSNKRTSRNQRRLKGGGSQDWPPHKRLAPTL